MSIVLSQADLDYSGMKKIGRVTICERPSQLGDRIWIDVDGFEFDDLPTCRMQSGGLNSDGTFYFRNRAILKIAAPFISTCGNRTCFFSQMNKNDLLIPSWV